MAKQAVLIHLPANLSFAAGAAIPIAGKTALGCMRELNLNSGDRLFIAGASGAIGSLVIQLAKAKGIIVSASASSRNQEYMKSLGASFTVDYNDPDWANKVKKWSDGGVDKALAIQPGTGIESIQVVRDRGELITVSGDHDAVPIQRNIQVRQMGHQLFGNKELIELVDDISNDKINVVIEKEFAFKAAVEALTKTESRRARGKSIVKMGD